MRALNLSAFEVVDYVLIDDNKTPIKLLKNLGKSNLFAKGFEYSDSLPLETLEEKIAESYGGNMLFTLGSCLFIIKFIDGSLPSIGYEKLILLMNKSNKFDDLIKLLMVLINCSCCW